MQLKPQQTILILALIIGVSGCGFKLRGTADPLPEQIRQLVLTGINKDSDFYRSLAQALIGAGASLDSIEVGDGGAILTIHSVAQSRDEVSVSGSETIYRVNFVVNFSLSRGEQTKLIDARQLRASREFTFDTNNPYGLEQQDISLRKELKRDVIQKIIHQIRAAGLANGNSR